MSELTDEQLKKWASSGNGDRAVLAREVLNLRSIIETEIPDLREKLAEEIEGNNKLIQRVNDELGKK